MTAAMKIGADRGRSWGRTPLAVLLAVAALLVQALLPAAAMAAESLAAVRVELCTPQGAKTVVLDRDGRAQKGFAGLPCSDCLGATLAVTTPPALSVVSIAYAAPAITRRRRRRSCCAAPGPRPAPLARAPQSKTSDIRIPRRARPRGF